MLVGNVAAAVQVKEAQKAALLLGQEIRVLNANNEHEIESAFASFTQQQARAVLVSVDPLFDSRPEQLVALAARHAMPTIYYLREFITAGGLISYGASISDTYRQAGIYAGRILKGEKPGDLPIVLPTKFDVVLNLKTAKALGIAVPTSILLRANEVIE